MGNPRIVSQHSDPDRELHGASIYLLKCEVGTVFRTIPAGLGIGVCTCDGTRHRYGPVFNEKGEPIRAGTVDADRSMTTKE